jgi:hypothetical protein
MKEGRSLVELADNAEIVAFARRKTSVSSKPRKEAWTAAGSLKLEALS